MRDARPTPTATRQMVRAKSTPLTAEINDGGADVLVRLTRSHNATAAATRSNASSATLSYGDRGSDSVRVGMTSKILSSADPTHHTAMSTRHFRAASRQLASSNGLLVTSRISVGGATMAAAATHGAYPSKPIAAVEVFWAMPWKASISRPI